MIAGLFPLRDPSVGYRLWVVFWIAEILHHLMSREILQNSNSPKRCSHHHWGYVRWTPHPVIVTIRDNRDYIRVLLYSYYTTMTGWGVLLRDMEYGARLPPSTGEILNTDCQPALSLQTLLATVDTTYLQVSCSMIARTDAVLSFSQIFLLWGLGFHDTNTKGTSPVGHVTCSIKSMCGENCKHGRK